jgi:hypothetical protein
MCLNSLVSLTSPVASELVITAGQIRDELVN